MFCNYAAIGALSSLYAITALALAPPTIVVPPHQNVGAGQANDMDAHYVRLQGVAGEEPAEFWYKYMSKACRDQGQDPEIMTEKKFTNLIYDIYYSKTFTITYKTFESIGLNKDCKLQRSASKKEVHLNTPYGFCEIDIKGKFASGGDGACADFSKDTNKMIAHRRMREVKVPPSTSESDMILNHKCMKFTPPKPPVSMLATPAEIFTFCVMKPEMQLQPSRLLMGTYGIVLSQYVKGSAKQMGDVLLTDVKDIKAVEVLMDTKVSKRVFFPHHADHDFKIPPRDLNTEIKEPWIDRLRSVPGAGELLDSPAEVKK